jgi:hypothetical protein
MFVATQFSVFLINKPGVLAQTLNALAASKVNILAMTLMDSMEHGVLRVVTSQTDQARQVFSRINAQVTETDVLCLTLSNQPGALAAVATLLAESHININYAYCTAGARGGKTTGILKVADVKKAMKILESSTLTRGENKKAEAVRPSVGRGKR